ncbi:ATP-binding protein [Candidatus Latescibacterota bacterium]
MISINKQLCDLCGTCVGVCAVDALIIGGNELIVNSDKCTNCSACVYICPVEAVSEEILEL